MEPAEDSFGRFLATVERESRLSAENVELKKQVNQEKAERRLATTKLRLERQSRRRLMGGTTVIAVALFQIVVFAYGWGVFYPDVPYAAGNCPTKGSCSTPMFDPRRCVAELFGGDLDGLPIGTPSSGCVAVLSVWRQKVRSELVSSDLTPCAEYDALHANLTESSRRVASANAGMFDWIALWVGARPKLDWSSPAALPSSPPPSQTDVDPNDEHRFRMLLDMCDVANAPGVPFWMRVSDCFDSIDVDFDPSVDVDYAELASTERFRALWRRRDRRPCVSVLKEYTRTASDGADV